MIEYQIDLLKVDPGSNTVLVNILPAAESGMDSKQLNLVLSPEAIEIIESLSSSLEAQQDAVRTEAAAYDTAIQGLLLPPQEAVASPRLTSGDRKNSLIETDGITELTIRNSQLVVTPNI
jgi:hypothetical protein